MQSRTIGARGELLMKTQDCVKTPLMAAFWAAQTDRRKTSGQTHPPCASANSTNGECILARLGESQLSTLRKPGR
jgi:hypothetical protein